MIVGGYAVALHGHPRYTNNLDIGVKGSSENSERILSALDKFGFGSLDINEKDFKNPDQVVQLGYPPKRIDLLNHLEKMNFDACYSSRVAVEINDVTAVFIGLNDLKKSKKASGRHQDLADLENLGVE